MGENEKGIHPKQIRGLEEAYKKIEMLENEVKIMKESMLTKEEYLDIVQKSSKAFKQGLEQASGVPLPDPD